MLDHHPGGNTGKALLCTVGLICGTAVVFMAGCAEPSIVRQDPEAALKAPSLSSRERTRAIDQIWTNAGGGEAGREQMERIAWGTGYPRGVRWDAIQRLINDPDDHGHEKTRRTLRLLMQDEPDRALRRQIAEEAARRGWIEFTPVIVRSLALTPVPERLSEVPEYAALRTLWPSRSVEETAMDVFVSPVGEGVTGYERSRAERNRDSAWVVLARLDASGASRVRMLSALGAAGADDPLVGAVMACLRDLGCIPLTPSQVKWVRELRDFTHDGLLGPSGQARSTWWSQTASAVARLDPAQREGLRLRHMESLRWAAEHRGQWLTASRAQLLAQLRGRLAGRQTFARGSESLADHADRLVWGDLLTMLVLDDVVRSPGMARVLWEQAVADHKDTTTEYGGILELAPSGTWTASLYPPRAIDRRSDREYIAPPELFARGPLALAHYHFHAQSLRNREYAGPGPGDMAFAVEQGRANLVLTPVDDGVLNVDYYAEGNIAVDLGTIRR
jgi:hypothetical protein